jgi:hypothetical protein
MVAKPQSNALCVPALHGAAAHCRGKSRRNVAPTRREETMKKLLSSRQLIKMWHRREKATIDHLVRPTGNEKSTAGTTHSAFTSSGLAVEDQIRKSWCPGPMGLAIF